MKSDNATIIQQISNEIISTACSTTSMAAALETILAECCCIGEAEYQAANVRICVESDLYGVKINVFVMDDTGAAENHVCLFDTAPEEVRVSQQQLFQYPAAVAAMTKIMKGHVYPLKRLVIKSKRGANRFSRGELIEIARLLGLVADIRDDVTDDEEPEQKMTEPAGSSLVF